ncbi:polyribonucleotide nucleotidyltransferase [Lasius niger]|uniref:Polyribonucleotide nucleotidyltransferase n=1 Tax=Lasius niger TaxID=67767 RepID=A0A0J7N7W7_LASNI|nr:polyribonucleotide nucleotidyltransferase [Lasius niger]
MRVLGLTLLSQVLAQVFPKGQAVLICHPLMRLQTRRQKKHRKSRQRHKPYGNRQCKSKIPAPQNIKVLSVLKISILPPVLVLKKHS